LIRGNDGHPWFQNFGSEVLMEVWQIVHCTLHCLVFVCGLFAASVRLTVHVPGGGRGRGRGGAGGASTPTTTTTTTTTTLPHLQHKATTTATY